MPKKITIDENLAIQIANLYSEPDYSITEQFVCNKFNVTKTYFRKSLDYVIVLGIINLATVNAIAKKADTNYNIKLKELGYQPSDKIKNFYNYLSEKRKEYLSLISERENIELYFNSINKLEEQIKVAEFQESTHKDFIASEDEQLFIPMESSFILKRELEKLKKHYQDNVTEYKKISTRLDEIIKSVS